jgi:hypothetical protein
METLESLTDKFSQNEINSGWLEFCEPSVYSEEPAVASQEEYISYMAGAQDRLVFQGIIGDALPSVESIRGWEVGDDRMDQSHSPTGLAIALHVQSQVFKMETSEDDTFISNSRYNFCEVTSVVPRTVEGSYDRYRKTQQLDKLEYVDVMPMRLIQPVSKGAGDDHSSSVIGKSNMAGVKQSFSRDDLREEMFFTNFLQDGCLMTNRASEPKYLPRFQGGAGAPALYGDYRTLYLYMVAYKGGGYSRVYGTSTQEIRDCLYSLETSGIYLPPHFSLKLRDKQEYLHGTYAEKVFVPTDSFTAREKGVMPKPIYELGSANNALASYEARLLSSKVLLTRRAAEVEVERTDRTNEILFGFETVNSLKEKKKFLSKEGRAKFEGALSANSAFARLLVKQATPGDEKMLMKDKAFHVIYSGAREFTLAHAKWITEGFKSDTYGFRDLLKCEDMFLRSEVSTEEDMKVAGISRLWRRNGKDVITQTRAEVGLWRVTTSAYEWAHDIASLLIKEREELDVLTLPRSVVARIYLNNREMTADDPLIVAALLQYTAGGLPTDTACIVTGDRVLCRSAATKCGINILRLSPYAMPFIFKGKDMQDRISELESIQGSIGAVVKLPENLRITHTMVDTGSVAEMLMKHSFNDIGEGAKTYRTQTIRFLERDGKRVELRSFEPTKTQDRIDIGRLRRLTDPNGYSVAETFVPEKRIMSKLPKFENYGMSGGRSSRGPSSTSGSSTPYRRGRPALSDQT